MTPRQIFEIIVRALSDSVLIFTALFLNFALFMYAILYPDTVRFAVAGLFSITVFLPVLKIKGAGQTPSRSQEREAA